MNTASLVISENDDELAEKLCIFFEEIVRKSIDDLGFASAAISGGRTPDTFFRKMAAEYKDDIDWNKVILFWTDERCVPPNDVQSNFGRANELLLSKIDIPHQNIFRIAGESDPHQEAIRYSEMIEMNLRASNDLPAFDFILLGVGEDGHTASIFPGDEELFKAKSLTAVTTNPSSGQQRITMTGSLINNAKNIAVAATGAGKRNILTRVLDKNSPEIYPIKLVSPVDGEMVWFLTNESFPDNITA